MQLVRCATLGLAAAALVTACTPEVPRTSFKYAERRGVLSTNGLRFVIMPDSTTTQVEVDVRYEVGSREDPPGKAGIAHLVEHLMFQQRPDGESSPPLMRAIDGLTTYFNAYTNWDTTHYQMASRADQLDALLKIEAMRMYFRCQTISEDEFLREREVVRNEIRQRGGTPEGQIPVLTLAEIYPKNHAYARMVGGDDSNLTSITLKDACDFMEKYYTPDRATVIVAGGVDVDKTAETIKKWFGPLEKRTGAPRVAVEPVKHVSKGKAEYQLDIERPVLVVAWPLPAANTPEGRAAQSGISDFFFSTAAQAQEYDFAYDVSPAILGGQEAPVFGVIVELKGMDRMGEALETMQKAAKSAGRNFQEGTWQMLEEFKSRQTAGFLEGLESLAARTEAMGNAVQFDTETEFGSDQDYLMKELSRIREYDGPRIASAVEKALAWDKAKVIVFKPSKEGIKGDKRAKVTFQTKSHDRRENPEVDPREAKQPLKVAADFKAFDNARRFTLGNGMNVVLLPLDSPFPLVSAQLQFAVGTTNSGATPGLAGFAASQLRPPLDMDAGFRVGIGVGGQANRDTTVFFTGGLDIYLDVILKLLERQVKAGTYSQEGVEGYQKAYKARFARKDYQQQVEYQRQILTALFGADHPYTLNGISTPESVSGISYDKLVDFQRKHYSAGNATLILAGKFDVAKAESLVRSTFGGWPKGHVDQPVSPAPRERSAPEIIGVVGDESPQMTVTIAYPAPAGVDGQEAARRVMTAMLGLRMEDIRFKLGASYGVYAFRQPERGPSAYQMGGNVDAPRAGEALAAMRGNIERLRKGEDFDVDFVRARRKLIEDLLGQATVSSEMASRLGTIARFTLPPDYYEQLIKQIAAASPAQVKMLIARELDPKNEVVVCLADRPTLEKAFREAGLEQVKLIEPNYK